MQNIIHNDRTALRDHIAGTGAKRILLVHGSSYDTLPIRAFFEGLEGVTLVHFTDFSPNPELSSCIAGTELLRRTHCDMIAAVGGGSAMDVAKCIRLFADTDLGDGKAVPVPVPRDIPLLAVPTTAGSGSESTRFAVIYLNGEKQSLDAEECLPDAVLLDAALLQTLPDRQRRATMMDALSHAVESLWSVRAAEESMELARAAIRGVYASCEGYLANTTDGNAGMLEAANLAGQAINLTKTTAGHAMCYQLTVRYGLPHGHAAALCNAVLFPHMLAHPELCVHPRGEAHLRDALQQIAEAMGCETPAQAAEKFAATVRKLGLTAPHGASEAEIAELTRLVNPERLGNHPIRLDADTISALYRQIFAEGTMQ